eukprot:Phypoly_transcript_11985.p1 GENE.Phypoly_transcript_11985~~Phypoly_transcript_11985.p1  ORF type:complete len:281 (+),score=47.10 Phypoly_transcript_11985:173-1015(+)
MEAVETKEPASETPQKEEPTTTTTSTTSTPSEQPAPSAEESKKEEPAPPKDEGEKVSFTIAFKKQTFNVEFGLDSTIGDLRQEVAKLSGVPAALQKLMLKGMLKNDSDTLRTCGFKNGVKVMLIGSSIEDVLATASTDAATVASSAAPAEREYMSEKLPHKKIIDKGKPEDVMYAVKFKHEPLPQEPLQGILNNRGDKVRLTFKVFSQELWISSKSSTQKIPFLTVKGVQSEPIKGQEEYHIMSLQLGNSDATKYYLYWVPAQYVRAVSNTIMSDYSGLM